MNYELAKKLKDAGFPRVKLDEYYPHGLGSHSDTRDDEPCYCNQDHYPTLSELIEACGEKFGTLTRVGKKKLWPIYGLH